MKTISVRELQHHLAKYLEQARRGQQVAVARRGTVVARIVPADVPSKGLAWPDSAARMKRLPLSGRVRGKSPSAVIGDLRRDRL
ncbi:MAG TPA: type II toxin-antitoxin system prevent-host-death family antitoxin [Polyangiaceae bacterium]